MNFAPYSFIDSNRLFHMENVLSVIEGVLIPAAYLHKIRESLQIIILASETDIRSSGITVQREVHRINRLLSWSETER